MSNTKSTKRALLSSVMAMLLCVAMLIGTTFAWFNDSVTSSGNKIQAGTLNIDLLVESGDGYVSVKDSQDPIFDYDKWEPGYTEVKNVMVKTTGNLALKYTLKIVPQDVTADALKLAEVIDVYYAASQVAVEDRDLSGLTRIGTLKDVFTGAAGTIISDTLIPGENDEDFATIVLKMQESAGNDYQGLSVGNGFDLHVLATQYTYEDDSFDDQYDKDAEYRFPAVTYEAAEKTASAISANVYNQLGTTSTARYLTWAEVQEQVGAVADVSFYAPFTLYEGAAPTTLTINGVEYTADSKVALSVGNNNFIKDKVFYCENGTVYLASPVAMMEVADSADATALTVNNVAFQSADGGSAVNTGDNNYTVTVNKGNKWLGIYYAGAEAGDLAITRKVSTIDGVTTVAYGTTLVEDVTGNPVAYYPVGWNVDGSVPAQYEGATLEYTIYIVDKGIMQLNFTYTRG